MKTVRFGVDLGGTKIEVAALDANGRFVARERTATPSHSYTAIVTTIRDMILGLEQQRNMSGTVGVAMPGALSPATGVIKNANTTCMIGRPFDQDLSDALERPVRLCNDADGFALSEAVDGAAAGCRVVFGVIIGTGVGGGIVIDASVLGGANGIAGEWGHNALPWPNALERPGPLCYCGKRGCIETFLSGPGLADDHRRTTGDSLSSADIAILADGGEINATASMARYCDRLARALAGVINIVDPDAIVLGGGVSNIAMLYRDVPRIWSRYVFSDIIATRLLPATHGDSSGVRGAAWLWPAA